MAIEPAGHRVLVEPKEVEKVTEGGIIIPEMVREKERVATEIGKIVAVGPNAWKAFDDGTPWAKVGDTVIYAKYGGRFVKDPETNKDYVVLNDEDVLCIVKE